MALVPPNLNRDILKAFDASKKASSPAEGEKIFAMMLTKAIDKYIKSGTVVTAGTAVAQTGVVQ